MCAGETKKNGWRIGEWPLNARPIKGSEFRRVVFLMRGGLCNSASNEASWLHRHRPINRELDDVAGHTCFIFNQHRVQVNSKSTSIHCIYGKFCSHPVTMMTSPPQEPRTTSGNGKHRGCDKGVTAEFAKGDEESKPKKRDAKEPPHKTQGIPEDGNPGEKERPTSPTLVD